MSIVYSTGAGRICPGCRRPVAQCACKDARGKPARAGAGAGAGGSGGAVRVARSTQGRGGKVVSVVSGLPLDADGLTALAADLKKRCGAGGTVREGLIEIQGEHRDTLVAELVKRGYAAKRAGG